MKKLLIATISLCIAVAAPAMSVSADEAQVYPQLDDSPLVFTALSDYAVGENGYAFAEGKNVIRLDGELRTEFTFLSDIAAIDYITVSGTGGYYFSYAGSEAVYSLPETPDKTPVRAEGVTLQSLTLPYTYGEDSNYIYNIKDGALNIWDGATEVTPVDGTFKNLKEYGGFLYVQKDNAVCKIDGTAVTEIDFRFSNYNLLEQIPVGDAAEKLKTYTANPTLVTITAGCHVTRFDGEKLEDGGNFPIEDGRTATSDEISGGALLLCTTGNASIVAIGTECYILATENTTASFELAFEDAQGDSTVNADEYLHSMPYLSGCTATDKISAGDRVTVTKVLRAQSYPQLAHDFYLVETADGKTGYVAAEFLETPVFDEDGPSTLPDPAPQTDDNVKTVVLILVVIVLVLIAAGYLTWIGTSGKRKKDDKDSTGKNSAGADGKNDG